MTQPDPHGSNRLLRYRVAGTALWLLITLCPLAAEDPTTDQIHLCHPENYFDTEPAPHVRIMADCERILQSAETVPNAETIRSVLPMLMGTTDSSIEERLAIAAQLRQIAEQLEKTPGHKTVSAQLLRRVYVAEAALKSLTDLKTAPASGLGSESIVHTVNSILCRNIDIETTWREVHCRELHRLLSDLRSAHPSVADAIDRALQHCYGGPNLRIVVPEKAASTIVGRVRVEKGPVSECLMGAQINGTYKATARPAVQFIPNDRNAQLTIVVEGTVKTVTRAVKGPATVDSEGNHCFTMQRPLRFCNDRIRLEAPNITVVAKNCTTGLTTKFDNMPLARKIARKKAWQEIRNLERPAEKLTEERISAEALRQFCHESDRQLGDLDRLLCRATWFRSRYVGKQPKTRTQTTSSHLTIETTTQSPFGFAAWPALPTPGSEDRIVVQLHESLVNTMLDGLSSFGEQVIACLFEELQRQQNNQTPAELLRLAETRIEETIDLLDTVIPVAGPEVEQITRTWLAHESVNRLRNLLEERLDGLERFPRLHFRHCDPLRLRIDDNQVVFILNSLPRRPVKNRHGNSKIPRPVELRVTPVLKDGYIRFAEIDTQLERMLHVIETMDSEDKIDTAAIRQQLDQRLNQLTANRLLQKPDDIDLRFCAMDLKDGWITLEIAVRQNTGPVSATKPDNGRKTRPPFQQRLHDCLWKGCDCSPGRIAPAATE